MTAPATAMPLMVVASVPRPPRLPGWTHEYVIEEAPSSQLDFEVTQTRLEPWFPPPQDDDYMISGDGLIRVPRLRERGWSFDTQRAELGGARVTLVGCRRTRRTQSFFMVAKDYEVPAHAVVGLEELCASVYGCEDEGSYSEVLYCTRGFVEHHGHAAYELHFEATHTRDKRKSRIRRSERVMVVGAHVLTLRAEGSLRSFARYRLERERFFGATRFSHLR